MVEEETKKERRRRRLRAALRVILDILYLVRFRR